MSIILCVYKKYIFKKMTCGCFRPCDRKDKLIPGTTFTQRQHVFLYIYLVAGPRQQIATSIRSITAHNIISVLSLYFPFINLLAHLSTKCSWWAIVVIGCPSSVVVRRPSTFDVYTLETTFVTWFLMKLDQNVCFNTI